MNADGRGFIRATVLAAGLLIVTTVLVRTAWVCDDAFITFRVIDNLWQGHGLRYNPAERVQVYTHPLWMLALLLASTVTRDLFLASMLLGIVLSVGAVAWIGARIAGTMSGTLLALSLLTLSKAFVDFSTSGLEGPLGHLLLALFCGQALAASSRPSRLGLLGLLAGLGALNRMDTILISLPVLARELALARSLRACRQVAMGFPPLLAWVAFATFYYGFALPTPAYAKIGTGLPASVQARQGVAYLANSLRLDPITLLAIAAGIILPLAMREARSTALAAGSALYLLYIVRIGGDFMSGRFLTPPLLCAASILAFHAEGIGTRARWGLLVAAALAGLGAREPTIWSGKDFGKTPRRHDRGIADERAFYYQGTGLLPVMLASGQPSHRLAEDGRQLRIEAPSSVTRPAVGMVGFYAGPRVHVIDIHAIVDPLLSRLPMMKHAGWRPGHYRRRIPLGYAASVGGSNRIVDRRLHVYYEKVRLITRDPLSSRNRLMEIARFNLSWHDRLIKAYGEPPRLLVTKEQVRIPPAPGSRWDSPGVLPLGERGIEVDLGGPVHAARLDLSLDNNGSYDVAFLHGGSEVGWLRLSPQGPRRPEITARELVAPAVSSGYERLIVQPSPATARSALGHLRLH